MAEQEFHYDVLIVGAGNAVNLTDGLDGLAIVPVMIGDARRAGEMAERLLAEGLYVVAFSYPVVPNGAARIRTQMSAAHTDADIDQAVAAFTRVGREMGVVS